MTAEQLYMSDPDIDILYRDEHLLVANKSAGLATVPGKGPDKHDSLITRLLKTHPNSRVVHRLDQPTSGLVIIPQSYDALRHIGQQFAERQVSKTYIAVVDGTVKQDSGSIELPLICDWPNRPLQIVDHTKGKAALTHYRVLERSSANKTTRVELKPVTGRSHQLRVHMLALGHVILGDWLYGPKAPRAASARLLLHAQHIDFTHPASGELLSITAPAPF